MLFKVSLVFVYHCARVISGMILILAGWLFFKTLNLTHNQRKWGLILFCLGIQFPTYSHDYWGLAIHHPEASAFANILVFPHIAFSQAMFLLSLYFFRMWLNTDKSNYLLWVNFAALGMVIIHPFMLLPYSLMILVSFFWRRSLFDVKQLLLAAASFVACTPYLIYFVILMTHPDVQQWQIQINTTFKSPLDPIYFNSTIMIMGIVGLCIIYGTYRWRNEVLWLFSLPLLIIFIPFCFQERLLEAAGPCLSFAGGITINSFGLLHKKKCVAPVIFTILLIPVFMVLLATVVRPPAMSFMSEAEVLMYEWMDRNLTQEDVVLAMLPYASRIPAKSGCRVWYGHHDQTFKVKEKRILQERFFTDTSFDREDFLTKWNIKYVLLDTSKVSLPSLNSLVFLNKFDNLVLLKHEPYR
jgi:hypothetical protein